MKPEPSIRVRVDLTNPGQFFACCGLFELADRLWQGAEGWFDGDEFHVACDGELAELMKNAAAASLSPTDPMDKTASPLYLEAPFRPILLDWWHDDRSGGKELKVWAGTMESLRIARAMQWALADPRFHSETLFDVCIVVLEPDDRTKKVEPFCFDSRRAPNAHSRDVGFSPNDLSMTSTATPAVEFLALVGLQRALPVKTNLPRTFRYFSWCQPLPVQLVGSAAAGFLDLRGQEGFQFENWYRTGQKKHKAFRSAIPLSKRGEA